MRKKILLTRELHPFALRELGQKFSVRVHSGRIPMPKRELIAKIRDAEGLICFPYDRIDREVMDSAPGLKVISTYSVGLDHIDVGYAKKRRIRVGYTPEVLTDATAELTVALMLDVLRRSTEGDRIIRSGGWRRIYGAYDYVGVDVRGKTLGILGMGRIGEGVARRAAAFDMEIIYHSRTRLSRSKESKLGARYVKFEDLIAGSDVLSLHVPHTEQTDRLIDLPLMKKMRRTAYLINTARGGIVSEKDLVRALKQKIIAGAGLDVFETEPIPRSHPLCRLDNVVLAPHIGSSTRETRERMAEVAVRNLKLGIANKRPAYSVGY